MHCGIFLSGGAFCRTLLAEILLGGSLDVRRSLSTLRCLSALRALHALGALRDLDLLDLGLHQLISGVILSLEPRLGTVGGVLGGPTLVEGGCPGVGGHPVDGALGRLQAGLGCGKVGAQVLELAGLFRDGGLGTGKCLFRGRMGVTSPSDHSVGGVPGLTQRGLLVGGLGPDQVETVDLGLLLLAGESQVGGTVQGICGDVTTSSQVHRGGVTTTGVGGPGDLVELLLCLFHIGVGRVETSAGVSDVVLGFLGFTLGTVQVDAGLVDGLAQATELVLHRRDRAFGRRDLADEVSEERFGGGVGVTGPGVRRVRRVRGGGDGSGRLDSESSGDCKGQQCPRGPDGRPAGRPTGFQSKCHGWSLLVEMAMAIRGKSRVPSTVDPVIRRPVHHASPHDGPGPEAPERSDGAVRPARLSRSGFGSVWCAEALDATSVTLIPDRYQMTTGEP